jgi:hypothetical protein
MAILIDDIELEKLAQKIANADGVSVTEVLRQGLHTLIKLRGSSERKVSKSKGSLQERLAILARRVDAIPNRVPPDNRSDNEILGYNKYGLWD